MREFCVLRGPYLKPQDFQFYGNIPGFKVRFLGTSLSSDILTGSDLFTRCRVKNVFSHIMSNHKPNLFSFLFIEDFERCMENSDILNTIETYSFISRQCVHHSKKTGKKLVVSAFETIPYMFLTMCPPYGFNSRATLKAADMFIALTKRARNALISMSVHPNKIRIIYPGFDMDRFHPCIRKNDTRCRILFVGRLVREKGVLELLNSFKELFKSRKEVELWIAGKGPLQKIIDYYSIKLPIRSFGFVKYEKVPELYNQCDIFCLPSKDRRMFGFKIWEEQFGFVIVEALASGLPIVATNCGAIPEIAGPSNLFVPQGSEQQLTTKLLRLIDDKNLRLEISSKNRKRALQLFDSKKQKKLLSSALTALLE